MLTFLRKPVAQVIVGLLGLAHSAQGVEITVQNDSFVSGGSAFVVGDFVPGEEAGVRLTSPCNGTIVAVQIGWLSAFGTASPTIEQAIHIYNGATFPTPGPELAVLEAPLMTPGALNEFRYLDKQQAIPLSVPVTNGQQFYVTLEFANATNIQAGDASVFRDNGCQAGKNVIFAIPPNAWFSSCTLGVGGDFVIRAVIECPAATGACCLVSGACVEGVTAAICSAQGGTYQGDTSACGGVNCPLPVGACCLGNGNCSQQTQANCIASGGTFMGANTPCGADLCKGGCCVPSTGNCVVTTQNNCSAVSGQYQGMNTTCVGVVCFPTGACCLPSGECVGDQSPGECAAQSGAYQGNDTLCSGVNCPLPTGACCVNTICLEGVTEEDCTIGFGGKWNGALSTCKAPGACSNCPADIAPAGSGNGLVNVDDLLSVINAWGPCSGCGADIDSNGNVNVDDLLLVISAWGPCP